MINLKRFPGVLYRYRTQCAVGATFVLTLVYLMHRFGFVCTNHSINAEVDKLCALYENGETVGSLCQPLCRDKDIHLISCISQHSKQIVFNAKWNHKLIVIKSATTNPATERLINTREPTNKNNSSKNLETAFKAFDKKSSYQDQQTHPEVISNDKRTETDSGETEMEKTIRNLVTERLNLTLTSEQLNSLRYLEPDKKISYSDNSEKRKVERKNIFQLLESQEYLLSRLFSEKDVFPQILGTCGHFYGVEHLDTPNFNSVFMLDDKSEWSERMKLAVAIMDFVEEVETDFPDALYFCDIQMRHLGVTRSGRIKFLDSELVFTKNVVDKTLKSGRKCEEHKDCDLFDCRSFCNLKKKVCDSGVANDNLQAICEKIFIGWTMSGKIIIPGLLMSDYTPASLSALLRLCAENGRQPVPEDLRQRLYTILTEMHQILIQRLLSK